MSAGTPGRLQDAEPAAGAGAPRRKRTAAARQRPATISSTAAGDPRGDAWRPRRTARPLLIHQASGSDGAEAFEVETRRVRTLGPTIAHSASFAATGHPNILRRLLSSHAARGDWFGTLVHRRARCFGGGVRVARASASVEVRLAHAAQLAGRARRAKLVRLLAPEHGSGGRRKIRPAVRSNARPVPRGFPYGASTVPAHADSGDARGPRSSSVVDLQDIARATTRSRGHDPGHARVRPAAGVHVIVWIGRIARWRARLEGNVSRSGVRVVLGPCIRCRPATAPRSARSRAT